MSRQLMVATVVAAILVLGGIGYALSRQPSERGVSAAQPTTGEPSADQMQQMQEQQNRSSAAGEPGAAPANP